MRVYFYHTQDLNFIDREWRKGQFPGHLLYGATHLGNEGVEVVMHQFIDGTKPRWRRALRNAWRILTNKEHFDAIYGTRHNGIEIIIMLRALGLYRKPIVCWHHQPLEKSRSRIKEMIARLFYRGIDYLVFFSEKLRNESLASGRITTSKTGVCPWGADLDYYDRLMRQNPCDRHEGFISTGKELRDMPTLINAFASRPDQHLDIISTATCCGVDYEGVFQSVEIPRNVSVIIERGKRILVNDLAHAIWPHKAICICCKKTNYTVGLTTLVEALAFGLPVIVSRNPNFPFDVQEAGCGISVPYGDVDGWKEAIHSIASDPSRAEKMGMKARELAESTYNVANCAHYVAEVIKEVLGSKSRVSGQ